MVIEDEKCASVFATPILIDLPKSRSTNDNDNDTMESQYNAIEVSAGIRHTIVKTENGTLLGAGWNKYGQLARETSTDDITEFMVIDKPFTHDYKVICGDWSTIAIKNG